jgi:hypothetical protein
VTGPATISGTTITLDGTVGTVIVKVSQVGDDNFNAAEATINFEVNENLDVTSIEDTNFEINVYPNPVSNWLKIETGQTEEMSYILYTQNGVLVDFGTVNSNTSIDVQRLQTGFYLLRIKAQQLSSTTKILINR